MTKFSQYFLAVCSSSAVNFLFSQHLNTEHDRLIFVLRETLDISSHLNNDTEEKDFWQYKTSTFFSRQEQFGWKQIDITVL